MFFIADAGDRRTFISPGETRRIFDPSTSYRSAHLSCRLSDRTRPVDLSTKKISRATSPSRTSSLQDGSPQIGIYQIGFSIETTSVSASAFEPSLFVTLTR